MRPVPFLCQARRNPVNHTFDQQMMTRRWSILVVALVLSGCTKRFCMPSSAMAPTIPPGSCLDVDLGAYGRCAPKRFDIVVFVPPESRDSFFVFRVVGLPGEGIELEGDGLSINGEGLTPPDGLKYTALERFAHETTSDVTLGRSEYFVLGDNTMNARDSRFFGPVPRDDIVGKVIKIEPPDGP